MFLTEGINSCLRGDFSSRSRPLHCALPLRLRKMNDPDPLVRPRRDFDLVLDALVFHGTSFGATPHSSDDFGGIKFRCKRRRICHDQEANANFAIAPPPASAPRQAWRSQRSCKLNAMARR